jgi:hypothetical protein
MDANDHAAGRESLEPGQEMEVREPGQAAGAGVLDDLTPDGSVAWVWLNGQPLRRVYLAGNPVVILSEVPDAFQRTWFPSALWAARSRGRPDASTAADLKRQKRRCKGFHPQGLKPQG